MAALFRGQGVLALLAVGKGGCVHDEEEGV